MPLGVHTFAFAQEFDAPNMEAAVSRLSELGVKLVEIPLLRPDDLDTEATTRLCVKYGIEPTCTLGLPKHFNLQLNPQEVIDFLCHALDIAQRAGSRVLSGVTYSSIGSTTGQPPTQAELDAVAHVIGQAARYAGSLNMSVGLEPCNRYETHLLNTAAQTRRLLERIGADNAFIHLDTYHMHIEESGMGQGFQDAGEWLGYVHLSESHRGIPGTGNLHWDDCFTAMQAMQFDGPMVLESFNYMHPDIASALAVWKPVTDQPERVVEDGVPFLRQRAAAAGMSI